LILCFSQDSAAIHCRCGWKYDKPCCKFTAKYWNNF